MIFAALAPERLCLSSACLYPQMDMGLCRVYQMRDDVRRSGLYAYHPGVLPPLRDKAEFRRVCAEGDPLSMVGEHGHIVRYRVART